MKNYARRQHLRGFLILNLDSEDIAQNPPYEKQDDIKPKPFGVMRQML